jgi:RNA polymerase sigma factor (sigma-70 family)
MSNPESSSGGPPLSATPPPRGIAAAFQPEALRAALLRYAARLLNDLPLAEDVVQDVMMRFTQQRTSEVDLSGREAEWMFTVCRRRVIDLQRKSERMSVTAPEELDRAEAGAAHPALGLETAEAQAALRTSIATLPDNQQEVIRLKFQNGFSYKEIAQITGLSAGNVGFLIHTALSRLRREFANQGHT